MKGIIKKINEKGFGFIAPESGAKDVFFHATDLIDVQMDDLHEGDTVNFEMGESEKGPKATQVTLAGSDSAVEESAVEESTEEESTEDESTEEESTEDESAE